MLLSSGDRTARFDTLPFSLPGFPWRGLGFATCQQARHAIRPNRVHVRFGLAVHLQLLSTWPRGHAVTFSYGPENVCPARTRTSLIWYTLKRTDTGFQPVSHPCGTGPFERERGFKVWEVSRTGWKPMSPEGYRT